MGNTVMYAPPVGLGGPGYQTLLVHFQVQAAVSAPFVTCITTTRS